MRLVTLVLLLLAAAALGCAAPADEGAGDLPSEAVDDLRDVVEGADEGSVGGVVAHVETPDGAVTVDAGMPGTQWEEDPAAQAFRVASVTKLVTSAVVLQLAEEGELALDDPVADTLPQRMEAFDGGEGITVRHLLGHTSGLADYLRNPDYWAAMLQHGEIADGAVAADCSELALLDPLDFVPAETAFEPGTDYTYSNAGYLVAGELIEEVTGESLERVYRERVLDPLGLERTWLACEEEDRAELVPGYHAPGSFGITIPGQSDEPAEVTGVNDPNMWAAGGLVSTAVDVAALARALFAGELFEDEGTLEEMLEPTAEPTYGLGVRLGDGTVGHDGLAAGYGTHLHHDPDAGRTVVVVVNETSPDLPGEVGGRIRDVLVEHLDDES